MTGHTEDWGSSLYENDPLRETGAMHPNSHKYENVSGQAGNLVPEAIRLESTLPERSIPATGLAGQSPMPGWLHWLETTAVPATPAVFGHTYPVPHADSGLSGEDDDLERGEGISDSDAALVHDARGMVTALEVYCDLLAESGVLSASYRHYASELRLVASSSRRLLHRLDHLVGGRSVESGSASAQPSGQSWLPGLENDRVRSPRLVTSNPSHRNLRVDLREDLREPISSLADELMTIRNLLAALAGPAITLGLSLDGGYRAIPMATDDLTRVMVNLVRNAADAMPEGGHIQITLRETADCLRLTIADTGTGLPEGDPEAIFAPGYSTHVDLPAAEDSDLDTPSHRGMGLAIVRSLVTAAGGCIRATNRPATLSDAEEEPSTGAVFDLEFPLA
jgi:signal transduction histidine kinase